jgi:hypothetical protein
MQMAKIPHDASAPWTAEVLAEDSPNKHGFNMKGNPSQYWTQAEAVALAREIEAIAPRFGAHVALTGGCLYKDGERKDVDILFYRIRQRKEIDEQGLLAALEDECKIVTHERYGWVQKASRWGKKIDLFFPETKQVHLNADGTEYR